MVTLGTLLGVAAVSYFAGVVRAGGAPTMHPLVYSGTLLDGSGNAVASQAVTVQLVSSMTSTTALCGGLGPATSDAHGRFRVELDTNCPGVIASNPELFVMTTVGSSVMHSHIGAVPYALEATHTPNADSATTAARHIITHGTDSVSVGGIYCGATAPTTGQFTGPSAYGYTNARTLCQQVGSPCSATAHMCRADELVRSLEFGMPIPGTPWYVSGLAASGDPDYGTGITSDCNGWNSAGAGSSGHADTGSVWVAGSFPAAANCSTSQPIACCD
jgi:hypothetical protein